MKAKNKKKIILSELISTMGKDKKQKEEQQPAAEESISQTSVNLSPIAHPLAGAKLQKKIVKAVKKGIFIIHSRLDYHIQSGNLIRF